MPHGPLQRVVRQRHCSLLLRTHFSFTKNAISNDQVADDDNPECDEEAEVKVSDSYRCDDKNDAEYEVRREALGEAFPEWLDRGTRLVIRAVLCHGAG